MPKNTLYAISDIHLSHKDNQEFFSTLPSHAALFNPNDGLILAGDVGESISHLRSALEISLKVFKHVWWVPGNHELYTVPHPSSRRTDEPDLTSDSPDAHLQADIAIDALKGEARYHAFVKVCREYGVYTPEDDWIIWDTESPTTPVTSLSADTPPETNTTAQHPTAPHTLICPLFTLYDYTFRPAHLTSTKAALAWAMEADIYATDEALLSPLPHASREEWCHSLVDRFATRLTAYRQLYPDLPFVLVNHWPLLEDLVYIPAIPRFSLWCGTVLTRDWIRRFEPVSVLVSGHLHVGRTDVRDGARCEEVSLGYPRQWAGLKALDGNIVDAFIEILPGKEISKGEQTRWRGWKTSAK